MRAARCLCARVAWAAPLLTAALALVSAPAPARADAAPLSGLAGSNIAPVEAAGVQLTSETVLLELWALQFENAVRPEGGAVDHLGAKVTADFQLDNPGAAQSLTVGFPLYLSLLPDSKVEGYFDLRNLRAFVNGAEVETERITVQGEAWSAWGMTFAPGATALRVTYDLPATTDACNAELGYLIHTGALWAGTIDSADVILRFGYPAEEMLISPQGGLYLGPITPGYTVQDFDVRWHYEGFEPDEADDIAVTFVTPSCWRTVLQARQALAADGSAENYRALAQALADIVFPHHGFEGPAIAQSADAQFRKAIELDPDNEELRLEYADFLSYQEYWALTEGQVEAGRTYLTQIAPTPLPTVTRQPDSPSVDATATAPAQASPTDTDALTNTPPPTALAEASTVTAAPPTATPVPASGGAGCLPGALPALALVGGGIVARRRRRGSRR